jgi:hypothetical protein
MVQREMALFLFVGFYGEKMMMLADIKGCCAVMAP